MNIIQVEFDRVFSGQSNFAPKAIVQCSMADIASRFHYTIYEGEDGLDRYSAIPMALQADHNEGFDFALWRHDGNPENTFSINASIYEKMHPKSLALILQQFDIPESHVIWRAPELATATEVADSTYSTAKATTSPAPIQPGPGATGMLATDATSTDAGAAKDKVARVFER